jgi:hypothetical protein
MLLVIGFIEMDELGVIAAFLVAFFFLGGRK